ncbi:hypothetical protein WJX74_000184 [Apatococcus lobatus]|uniref:Sas10 C-terminal domain-containing protein n=1 Tax=Apatococcus lobatus TaxID=904363 RepID=A0AAW1PUP0_9CHLO
MGRPSSVKKKQPRKEVKGLPADMQDPVDKFHAKKDRLMLNPSDDEGVDDSLDNDPVYDLQDVQDDSDEEESEEDMGGQIEEEQGQLGRLARQERMVRERVRRDMGIGDSDEEDEGAAAEDLPMGWGRKKSAYYKEGDSEGSDEEGAAKEEEAEAMRLQQAAAADLRPEDFGLDALDSDDGASSSGDEAGNVAAGTMAAAANQARAGVEVERLGAAEGLDADELKSKALADAPELAALLADLQGSLGEVRSRTGPLLKEVREGNLATAEGVSYLEAKHLLLLHYCMGIVFYLVLKAEGQPVHSHPVIPRLLTLRAYLDRIRPLDRKLQYQLDKLLAAAASVKGATEDGSSDPLQYGPNPSALMSKGQPASALSNGHADQDGLTNGHRSSRAEPSGVYVAPKRVAAAMPDDPDAVDGASARERRRTEHQARKAKRSQLLQELARDIEGAPEELRESVPGEDTARAVRERQRLEARAEAEEGMMARVPLTKRERAGLKQQRRAGLAGNSFIDDFADDVDAIVQAANEAGPRSAQRFGAELYQQQEAEANRGFSRLNQSGDAEVPARQLLHERRAKFDDARARQAAKSGALESDEEEVEGGGRKRRRLDGEEDDFYQQAKKLGKRKKEGRAAARAGPTIHAPLPDATADGARKVSSEIEKNRGLTAHRRKDIKNPRKKHRMAFDKAQKRRKGQVQGVRQGGPAYGGEATGIKSKVSKSRRFS